MRKALPVNRTPCFQALSLHLFRSSFFLLAVLLLLFPALAARAQGPGMHPGQSDNFSATGLTSGAGDAGNEQASLNTWAVHNNTGVVGASSTPSGWSVTYVASKGFTVTCPSTAAVGTVSAGTGYTVSYCTRVVVGPDTSSYTGPVATFEITTPPAKPGLRPGPAYDWETSVGGVNLANGNKLTSIPVVG